MLIYGVDAIRLTDRQHDVCFFFFLLFLFAFPLFPAAFPPARNFDNPPPRVDISASPTDLLPPRWSSFDRFLLRVLCLFFFFFASPLLAASKEIFLPLADLFLLLPFDRRIVWLIGEEKNFKGFVKDTYLRVWKSFLYYFYLRFILNIGLFRLSCRVDRVNVYF